MSKLSMHILTQEINCKISKEISIAFPSLSKLMRKCLYAWISFEAYIMQSPCKDIPEGTTPLSSHEPWQTSQLSCGRTWTCGSSASLTACWDSRQELPCPSLSSFVHQTQCLLCSCKHHSHCAPQCLLRDFLGKLWKEKSIQSLQGYGYLVFVFFSVSASVSYGSAI